MTVLDCAEYRYAGGRWLHLVAAADALVRIWFGRHEGSLCRPRPENPVLGQTARQLDSYFAGELRYFDLPLRPEGTPFQLRVWEELRRIPYGETRSYREVARAIGSPEAVRAVGAANGQNPIPIVVPCHRVIGANGKLTGFGGGLDVKRLLLDLEAGKPDLWTTR